MKLIPIEVDGHTVRLRDYDTGDTVAIDIRFGDPSCQNRICTLSKLIQEQIIKALLQEGS